MRSAKTTVIVSMLAGMFLTTSIGGTAGYFYITSIKAKYDKELTIANTTLKKLGPLTNVCVVNADSFAGQEITQEMIDTIQLPQSMINDRVVQDENDILGKYFKIPMKKGPYFTKDEVMQDQVDDSTRDIDIVVDYYPTGLKVGDYVDVRLVLPKGEDYITLSHKRVMDMNGDTIKIITNEREILFYSSALVDKFINQGSGSALYLTKYTDPGLQRAADVTYNIPDNILTVLTANPNVVDKVINGGLSRAFIETQFKNIAQSDGTVLSSGRATYQSKLEQARTFYSTKKNDGSKTGGDTELTDADTSSQNNTKTGTQDKTNSSGTAQPPASTSAKDSTVKKTTAKTE